MYFTARNLHPQRENLVIVKPPKLDSFVQLRGSLHYNVSENNDAFSGENVIKGIDN